SILNWHLNCMRFVQIRLDKDLQMHRKNLVVAGAAVICLSAAFAQQSKADVASCPSQIPFGLTTALTGNLALLGTQARNGVEFAVDEINAAGGIAGKKIALTTEDTGASSTDALNAMNRIIEGKPLIIFGSMISPHVFAQTEGVTKSETPFLVGATNAKITAQGSKWLFRTHVHDGQLAELIPQVARQNQARHHGCCR